MFKSVRESFLSDCGDSTPVDRHNSIRFVAQLAVWGVCFLAATWLLRRGVLAGGPLAWAVAAVPLATGAWAMLVYSRYLREADELQRLIHYQALALGFGLGWLGLVSYPLFEELGAPALEAADYTVIMMAAYAGTLLLGRRRYL